MARDLKTVVNESVFTAINGYDASTDKPMFNNLGNAATMTRTTDNWMHALVGSTGISPLNNHNVGGVAGTRMGGALITPRHMVFAKHYVLPVNKIVYFYDRNNVRYDRVITANAYHGMGSANGDYYVAVLDSDLPSEIEPLKVFPPDFYKYLDPSQITLPSYLPGRFSFTDDFPIIHTDQEEKSLISRATSIDVGEEGIAGFDASPNSYQTGDLGKMMYGNPIDTDLQAWREGLIAGDSGTPHFTLIDDELIFLGPTYTTARVDSIVNLRTHNDINKLIEDADTAAGFNTGYELTSYDMTGFKQYNIPDREYTFIGDDISNGTLIQFRGSVTDHNSYHYSIPYAATSVVRTDPRDDSQTYYDVTGISTSNQKWVGAAYASNKRIYAAPHAANGPLIINTEDPAYVTVDYIDAGYGLQTRGIALQDNGNGAGAAYMTSYSGSESTKKFTFDANGNESAITSLTYTVPTDPFETARGSSLAAADEAVFPFIYRSYWGAVNGGNDKIYGIPYGASQVQVIDLNDDSISFIDTDLTGNADYDTTTSANTDYFYLRCPQWNKYKGGVLASNGCIYSHGTHARSVLKIDTSDDSVTEIPYPYTIYSAMTAGYTGSDVDRHNTWGRQPASMFSVEGPDGKIYNTPWNLPYQIAIDPADDSISFNPLSAILDENSSGADLAWYTDGSLMNQQIFMAPGEADRILEIGFDGYTPAAWSTVTPYSLPSSSGSPPSSPSSPSASASVTPSPSEVVSPSPSQTQTPTQTPTETPTGTPTGTPTQTPTPSTSIGVTPTQTPSHTATPTGTPTGTPTPTVTPTVTPTNNNNRCVMLEYDVEDGPDRFIVTYKGNVIIDTGFVGNAAYVYGGYKRQVFIDALIKEGLDFSGTTLADDGYPVVDTTTEGMIESVESLFNEKEALVTIQSPVHDKPGWRYTLNCPMICLDPTPTGTPTPTQTPTQTQTQTPTPTGTSQPTPTASYTPSGTPTPTATPSQTSTPAASYPTPTPTPTGTPTPTTTPSETPPSSITATPTNTPTDTPTSTPTGTPPATITPTPSNTPDPSPSSTPSPSPSLTPIYGLVPYFNEVNEGDDLLVGLFTTNVPNGTVIPYTITGIDSGDLHESLTGDFTINNNQDIISLSAYADNITEGAEVMTITLDGLGVSSDITINDTSIDPTPTPSNTPAPSPSVTPSNSGTPSPTYALFPFQTPFDEGTGVDIGLYTTNIADGTNIPYTITGIDAGDLHEGLTGNFTINSGSDIITLSAVADNLTEGTEMFTITLDGTNVSTNVKINDTSVDPSPTPSNTPNPSPSNTPSPSPSPNPVYGLVPFYNEFDEGESLTIGLYTTNVAEGTVVPYTITGIQSADINESLTGNFTISNEQDTITITAVEDGTTEGSQVMTITLDGLGVSSNVTLNDTSTTPTFSLVASDTEIEEGDDVLITLYTTGVDDGTNISYTITGIDEDDIDQDLTGNFTINSNEGSVLITALEDNTTEGLETMTLTLDGILTEIEVDILDTSTDPVPPSATPTQTPTPTPTPTNPNGGGNGGNGGGPAPSASMPTPT